LGDWQAVCLLAFPWRRELRTAEEVASPVWSGLGDSDQ
jgi:hypothetical protein